MKTRNQIISWTATMFTVIAMLTVIGCSNENDSGYNASAVEVAIDSIAEDLVEAVFAGANVTEPETVPDDQLGYYNDMLVHDSVVYAVFGEGLIAYDLRLGIYRSVACEEPLNAIAVHEGEIYVGGSSLYRVVDFQLHRENLESNDLAMINPALESMALRFIDEINVLESFGKKLMIGTGNGLYASSFENFEMIKEGINISALTVDDDGLWVGTNGQGLFRWDGAEIHKRFLIRDTAIFDQVNCLDYNRGHVYVGTDEALYIFDGGNWETLTAENGLPTDKILALDADGWMIFVGTDLGVTGYFNGDFYPVAQFDGVAANALSRLNKQVLVATDNAILMRQGREYAALIKSDFEIVRNVDIIDNGTDSIPGLVELNMVEAEDFDPATTEPVEPAVVEEIPTVDETLNIDLVEEIPEVETIVAESEEIAPEKMENEPTLTPK